MGLRTGGISYSFFESLAFNLCHAATLSERCSWSYSSLISNFKVFTERVTACHPERTLKQQSRGTLQSKHGKQY